MTPGDKSLSDSMGPPSRGSLDRESVGLGGSYGHSPKCSFLVTHSLTPSFLPSFIQLICQTITLSSSLTLLVLSLKTPALQLTGHAACCLPLIYLTSDVVPSSLLAPLPWENPPSLPGSPKSISVAWTSPLNLKLVPLPANLVFPLGVQEWTAAGHTVTPVVP